MDVFFQTVTVTNDSDGTTCGELKGWAKAGQTSQVSAMMSETICDGQTSLFIVPIQVKDAGITTKVAVELMDNDSFNPFLPSSQWPFPTNATWTNGYTPMWDWSTATGNLSTANATSGVKYFQISVNDEVGFTVKGWYAVSFVS
ncbi:MAG: hypothetical protein JWM76_714 [Pseudonocardiales bacterium]|nr:hypothetical protein [Pseudonocardiales bacterium]